MRLRLAQLLPFWTLTASSIALAEDAQTKKLEPLVVSAPLPKTSAETAQPVTVLTGDELRMKAGTTIGETLSQEIGIHNSSFGPGVGQPVIRGQSGPRVRVLQNSLGNLDVSTLSPDHANSTEPILAERIEVLRGPATLLYGSGAIGGIVNIIDNRIPDQVPAQFITGAAEERFNTVSDEWSNVLKLEGGLKNFAWHLDGFYRDRNNVEIPGAAVDETAESLDGEAAFNTKGFIANTDARAWSGTAGFSFIGERGLVGLSANYLENNYGIPPEAGEEKVRIDLNQARYDMKAEAYQPFPWAETLRLRLGYNDYRHTELENAIPGTRFDNEALEGRLELVHRPLLGFLDHGAIGFQALTRDFSATGEEAFVPRSDINSYALFAVETVHAGAWTFEFGLRAEHQRIDPEGFDEASHTPLNASASALWNITDNSLISLAFTQAQRAPEVQELFADGPHLAIGGFELGDARLEEETSHILELSFRSDYSWVKGEITFFHNWVDDYIFQANTGASFNRQTAAFETVCSVAEACLPVFQARQQDATFKGFEAELTFPLLATRYGHTDLTLFGDYVRGKFANGGDVPRLPPLRYGLQLDYGHRAWAGHLRLTRAEAQNNPGNNESPTDGYLLLDAALNYQFKAGSYADLLFFIKGNNLLDEEIRNAASFLRNVAPEPGRGVEFGLRASF